MSSDATAMPSRALTDTIAASAGSAAKPTPVLALARAREMFRAGEKLDMASLSRDLGVARATLYRWTGDREQLLGDVAWLEVKAIVDHLVTMTPGSGVAYIETCAHGLLSILADNPVLQSFLRAEGDDGMRLLTAPNGLLRPRLVAAVAEVIDTQIESGEYRAPTEARSLADGIVALGERFLYHGGDPELNPDPKTAHQMITLLLREPCADKGRSR